jgi:hypothetical protein
MLISHSLDLAAHVGDCDFEVDSCGWKNISPNLYRQTASVYVKLQHPALSRVVVPWYRTKISNIDNPALKGKLSMQIACNYVL